MIVKRMNLVCEFLEISTIHGLSYISTAKSVAAKATWVTIVCVSFGIAIFMINNAYTEWQESPIATTMTTRPISDLAFPSVTVCPPRGSNTALNLALERVKNENFTEKERNYLLNLSSKTFLLQPNQKYASHLVDLVNSKNLRSLLEGQISLPEVTGKYTFAIKSSQHDGDFSTPEYGIGNYSSGFYSTFHHHHYQLDFHNFVFLVGNGRLVVNIETMDAEEEWKFSLQEKRIMLYQQTLTFSDAMEFCETLGGHLPSIESQIEQDEVVAEAKDSSSAYAWLGGSDQEDEGIWTWTDDTLWNFTDWRRGEPSNNRSSKEEEDCLSLDIVNRKWKDHPCRYFLPFLCKVKPARDQGNRSFVLNRADILAGTFNLWWTNNPSGNNSKLPGLRLSWYVEDGSIPSNMEAKVNAISGKLSTPRLGSPAPEGYYSMDHTYSAIIGFPANITEEIGDRSLVIDIDVETPDRGALGEVELWFRSQLVFYPTYRTWHSAEAFCRSQNGHLASIASFQDKLAIDEIFIQVYRKYSMYTGYIWLGGTSEAGNPGRWVWTSHTPWKVDFWGDGEPRQGGNFLAAHVPFSSAQPRTWSAWGFNSEWPFVCRQKIIGKFSKDIRLTFHKDDLDFSVFYATWKTKKEDFASSTLSTTSTYSYEMNTTKNYTQQNIEIDLLTGKQNEVEIGGFTLTWFIKDNETQQNPDVLDLNESWKPETESMYEGSLLFETVDLVSQGMRQKLDADSLWETLLRHRWSKKILRDSSPHLTEETKDLVLRDVNRELRLTYSEAVVSDEELLLGSKLFFVLHYYLDTLEESAKLSIFYNDLLRNQNLRTIVQATLDNVLPGTEAIRDFAGMVQFFNELDSIYHFTKDLTPSMMAILSFDQLEELTQIGMNFLDVYKDIITQCLEEQKCKHFSDVVNGLGKYACNQYTSCSHVLNTDRRRIHGCESPCPPAQLRSFVVTIRTHSLLWLQGKLECGPFHDHPSEPLFSHLFLLCPRHP